MTIWPVLCDINSSHSGANLAKQIENMVVEQHQLMNNHYLLLSSLLMHVMYTCDIIFVESVT